MRPGNRDDKPRLAQFGEPDLKATTAIARRLVERYVYLIAKDRHDRHRACRRRGGWSLDRPRAPTDPQDRVSPPAGQTNLFRPPPALRTRQDKV
jgi:hypothetical protein